MVFAVLAEKVGEFTFFFFSLNFDFFFISYLLHYSIFSGHWIVIRIEIEEKKTGG